MADPVLVADDLHKWFGPTHALRGVSLTVERAEMVAVLGPSGSGKSTLLHCLAGVLEPDQGTVVLAGRPISSWNETDRSRLRLHEVGFVFQFGQLLGELTGLDNVILPLLLQGVGRLEASRRAAAWLDRLGVGAVAGQYPATMSGGQAQRVAIARAMVGDPAILFADEPTGSLDSLAAEEVMALVRNVVRDHGTSVVLITHDPRTAAHADRDVVVRDGRLSGATEAEPAARAPSDRRRPSSLPGGTR